MWVILAYKQQARLARRRELRRSAAAARYITELESKVDNLTDVGPLCHRSPPVLSTLRVCSTHSHCVARARWRLSACVQAAHAASRACVACRHVAVRSAEGSDARGPVGVARVAPRRRRRALRVCGAAAGAAEGCGRGAASAHEQGAPPLASLPLFELSPITRCIKLLLFLQFLLLA